MDCFFRLLCLNNLNLIIILGEFPIRIGYILGPYNKYAHIKKIIVIIGGGKINVPSTKCLALPDPKLPTNAQWDFLHKALMSRCTMGL